jgi:hypothetical protein
MKFLYIFVVILRLLLLILHKFSLDAGLRLIAE